MDGKLCHLELNLVLLWFVSLSSNTTESNSFFKISNRIFEKNRLFFKKMYEMRMKQL